MGKRTRWTRARRPEPTMQSSLKCLQINLNRSRAAHDLLESSIVDRGVDVVLASEPNARRVSGSSAAEWIVDERGDAGMWTRRGLMEEARGSNDGFVWKQLQG